MMRQSNKRQRADSTKVQPATKAERTLPKELEPFFFKPGQSGNPAGRPKGARNKLGEDFLQALQVDFTSHGQAAIAKVRGERPHEYLKVIASILPKEMKITVDEFEDLDDGALDARIRQLARALALEIGAGEASEGTRAPETVQ